MVQTNPELNSRELARATVKVDIRRRRFVTSQSGMLGISTLCRGGAPSSLAALAGSHMHMLHKSLIKLLSADHPPHPPHHH